MGIFASTESFSLEELSDRGCYRENAWLL